MRPGSRSLSRPRRAKDAALRAAAAIALALAACGPAETRFEASAAPAAAGHVTASGEAGLPDGAQLNVTLERAAGGDPLAVALPPVKGGRWRADLQAGKALPPGAYVVRVVFSPRAFAWSAAVKPAVGADGEKLGGPAVKAGDGYRYLERVLPVSIP